MSEHNDVQAQRITESFRKVLDRHGHPFQFRCLEAAKESQSWFFEAVEFPVGSSGPGTRIDFVLRHSTFPLYLLVECKRANPSLRDWCFVSFPQVRRNRQTECLFAEWLRLHDTGRVYSNARALTWSAPYYNLGLEVKGHAPGDPAGKGRGGIEDAATQVCRGLNGMVEFFSRNHRFWEVSKSAVLIPAVFTTAKLWGCDVDLGAATSLETGEIDPSKMGQAKEEKWVFYQYHQSPGLKHSLSSLASTRELAPLLDSEYVRSIPIVNSQSIVCFLQHFAELEMPDFYDVR